MTRPRIRKHQIKEQFAARPIKMLESPAYRVLTRAAHLALARIEIEFAHHGGKENGAWPVTFDDFEKFGLHRRAIAPAIRELIVLGFIELTRRGAAGNAEYRQPNLYRLTFRYTDSEEGDGTHEWRKTRTIAEAGSLAKHARQDANPRAVAAGRKHNPSGNFRRLSVTERATENA